MADQLEDAVEQEGRLQLGFGIAVREPHTDVGPVDDVLIIDKKPLSVIAARSPSR